jgi:hypothetical protein
VLEAEHWNLPASFTGRKFRAALFIPASWSVAKYFDVESLFGGAFDHLVQHARSTGLTEVER